MWRKAKAKMNCLTKEKKILILSSLVEGNSIRSTERITGVHRDTILRLLETVSKKCEKISEGMIDNIHVRYLQVDEIWTFVKKKQKRLTPEEQKAEELGDQYVFVGIDAETKLVLSYMVGKRDGRTAYLFMQNLNNRVAGRFQLTTDAFRAYLDAVDFTFGVDIDYAQLKKLYNGNGAGREGYSPSDINGTVPLPITGKPNLENISTSFVERQNLTMRMGMRRFTRLTNGFSKKRKNLKYAVALHFFYYNFIRIHQTLKVTPAMESGITDHIWNWDELLNSN
jgi:IS1 family transposase